MKTLVELLEQKREELAISKGKFALQLGLGKDERVAQTYYGQILSDKRSFPEKHFKKVAKILNLSVEELRRLTHESNARGDRRVRLFEVKVNAEDLRYLASIAEAAGGDLPLSLLIQHLPHRPTKAS